MEIDDEVLGDAAEFSLISENQGGEFDHGREKEGVQPQTLCTDPMLLDVDGLRAHSFEIGYKPGVRIRQEYDETTRQKVRQFERDRHTKFGHVISVPMLGAMAVRDRTSDDMIGAAQTISALKSFVRGVSEGHGQIEFQHASEDDVSHALDSWDVNEYSFTARPLNPTGGDLAKMRSKMYEDENIWQENGKVKAPPGENLVRATGTLGQTYELYEGGYAQIGFKGRTEDGHVARMPKHDFSQDKEKNLSVRESRPLFVRLAFDREADEDDPSLDVARALVRFYGR